MRAVVKYFTIKGAVLGQGSEQGTEQTFEQSMVDIRAWARTYGLEHLSSPVARFVPDSNRSIDNGIRATLEHEQEDRTYVLLQQLMQICSKLEQMYNWNRFHCNKGAVLQQFL